MEKLALERASLISRPVSEKESLAYQWVYISDLRCTKDINKGQEEEYGKLRKVKECL